MLYAAAKATYAATTEATKAAAAPRIAGMPTHATEPTREAATVAWLQVTD